MGSSTDHAAGARGKKQGSQLWKKALLHSSLCFVMGFFTGFAPSSVSDAAAGRERHHQRNVALGHIEHHRLAGVVLFAGLGDVFDLRFFDELRGISAFGAWPVATMRRGERKVVVRGPACSSAAVTGWFSQDLGGSGTAAASASTARPGELDVHGFAFNSSVLWDPERWGRYPTSEPDKSQDSMKFVQQVVLEDFSKVKGIPSDCSEVMVWHVDTAAPSLQN
uniref:Glycosyltransferases n=1 Tax=Zea mays TaxID=4577 RepID=A0A804LIE8_MAIZE